jgi:hypothetical protein
MRRVIVSLGVLALLALTPVAEAKYASSQTTYMSCAVDQYGSHATSVYEDKIPEPRATLVTKVENDKVIKVAATNHCQDLHRGWVAASWGGTMLLVPPRQSTDLWKGELDPMPRKSYGYVSLDAANPPWHPQACNQTGMVFMAEYDTHVPVCGAAGELVRNTKPKTPLPAGPPDRVLPCGDGKAADVWFERTSDDEDSEHLTLGGANRCKQWVLVHWQNPSETNRHESYLYLAPGKQFNWDRMHIVANGAGSDSGGGWGAQLVAADGVCLYVSDPDDPEDGFWQYAYTGRVYSWKDVKPVKDCRP